jgi:hypothetical protein
MQNIARSQLRYSIPLDNFISNRRRTKPTVSPDYIVGLTDGEGCFYVSVRPPYNKNGGAIIQLNFFIKVQEKDRKMLEKVKNTLGCGAVYFQHETRINHTQCYRYTVNSHRDIIGIIIPFFQKHFLQSSSKQKSFKIFCQIARLVERGLHHTGAGIKKIQKLKMEMNRRTRVVREIRMLRGNSK